MLAWSASVRLLKGRVTSLVGAVALTLSLAAGASQAWHFDPPTASADAPRWIACSLPLPPHTMQSEDGSAQGYASAMVLGVARRLGWRLEFRYMPWLRLVKEAQEGRCDLVYTVLKRSDYERFLLFPATPIQQRANVLVVRRESSIHYDGDLERFMRAHSVGLYQDKAVDEQFETWRRAPWAKVELSADARQNMEKLIAGRFDAAIENDITAIHELRKLGREREVRVLEPAINLRPAYVALPRGGRLIAQAEALDEALRSFQKTTEFREIERRYGGTTP